MLYKNKKEENKHDVVTKIDLRPSRAMSSSLERVLTRVFVAQDGSAEVVEEHVSGKWLLNAIVIIFFSL